MTLTSRGKIDLSCAGDTLRLGLLFHAFVPCDQVVLAIRDVLEFVVPAVVSLGKVGDAVAPSTFVLGPALNGDTLSLVR